MFFKPSRVPELIESVIVLLERLEARPSGGQGTSPITDQVLGRLEKLEHSRAIWEAEMEGVQLKAESRYKAASSAEARARTLKKATNGTDEGDGDGVEEVVEAYRALLSSGHVTGGGENEMQTVPEDLAVRSKASPVRMKFGV